VDADVRDGRAAIWYVLERRRVSGDPYVVSEVQTGRVGQRNRPVDPAAGELGCSKQREGCRGRVSREGVEKRLLVGPRLYVKDGGGRFAGLTGEQVASKWIVVVEFVVPFTRDIDEPVIGGYDHPHRLRDTLADSSEKTVDPANLRGDFFARQSMGVAQLVHGQQIEIGIRGTCGSTIHARENPSGVCK